MHTDAYKSNYKWHPFLPTTDSLMKINDVDGQGIEQVINVKNNNNIGFFILI